MKRLQIMIDEDLDAALGLAAARENTSKGALVRRYVAAQLRPLPDVESDSLWDLAGIAEGSPGDSASIDDVVYGDNTTA